MTGLLQAVRQHAAHRPEAIALDPAVAPPVTWRMLQTLIEARLASLTALAERTPYVLRRDHGVDAAVLEIALLEAGIPVLSLPAFFTEEQARHSCEACGVSDDGAPSPADGLLPPETARITFTSGSTGAPQGICLSASHMLTVAGGVVESVGTRHAGRHCALLPPGILLETVAGLFATVLAGGTYVCPPQREVGLGDPFRPDFALMLRRLGEWRITSLILVPEYLSGLVAAMEASNARLPDLSLVAVGGARVPVALVNRARAVGLPVRQGYGLTECASVVSLEAAGETEPGSAGRPLPHLGVTIAADGEIIIEGPMFLGTVGSPRAPGPLATGDIGRIDTEGRLWIEGRKSALIVTSFGRNISPEWVEAALTAQPGIAQAFVHGEGLPAPEALLVPARADSDLAAAVAAANAALPAYAQVSRWREVAHFTPTNGMLTGNGRLRRAAIAATWLERTPAFFHELEARTVRARLDFLTIPQLQAGLAGNIDRGAYLDYLAQAYHHVRHTVPLMIEARARLDHRPDLVAALDEYVEEETGHEEWILADIAAAGGDAEAVRRSQGAPATRAMVEHAYATIRGGNPAAFFGMVYVLESVSVALAQRGAGAVAAQLGLPPEAFTYLTSHGALDQEHMTYFADTVNRLTDTSDRQAIISMAIDIYRLFGAVFASIALEGVDVAA